MGILASGRKLLGESLQYDHALELLAPTVPVRTWDETAGVHTETPGTPTVQWSGLGSLQPFLRRPGDATPGEVGTVPEELPTYRAYLPNVPEVRSALAKHEVFLRDADADSQTNGQAFQLLGKPVAMAGKSNFRLELREK